MFVRFGVPCAAASFLPRPPVFLPSRSPSALASAPPYFFRSSWVESYLVASLSFWIVLARSVCWTLSLVSRESMRKLKKVATMTRVP